MFGSGFRVTRDRGRWQALGGGTQGLASWHPSAILRMRAPQRDHARAQLLADLRKSAGGPPDADEGSD